MEKLVVTLDNRTYPIIIMNGLSDNCSCEWPLNNKDRVMCITDDRVAPIYLDKLCTILNKLGVYADRLILSSGEQTKSLVVLDTIYTWLLSKNCDRDTILMALGGGVVGDITGFAAATYQRGIRFIQVPTTLLAQVDASIGGKTGVNHILGKNMIGSFHHPIAVIINLDCLRSLTDREFSSGLSEVIKYAIAFDVVFFKWLEDHLDELLDLNMQSLLYCVRRCCELKTHIVRIDEYDNDVRKFLNLGHTYGHAIESYLGYTQWSHGEAVSAGIMMAVNTALYLGQFNSRFDAERIKRLFIRANLPVSGPEDMQPEDYLRYMIRDKKSKLRQLNLVLPISIGHVRNFINVSHDLVLTSIKSTGFFK